MKFISLLRVAVWCGLCAGLVTGCRTRQSGDVEPTLIPTRAAVSNINPTQPAPTTAPPITETAPVAADPEAQAQGEAADQALQELDSALDATDTLGDLADDDGAALLQGLEQLEPTLQSVDTVNDLP